jgi:hypothetical protein
VYKHAGGVGALQRVQHNQNASYSMTHSHIIGNHMQVFLAGNCFALSRVVAVLYIRYAMQANMQSSTTEC